MESRDTVERFLSESHGHVGRALERWVGLLATEEDLQDFPEATDVRMKAEEFQNYAQQMENAVLSLAVSVEERAVERLRNPNRATTPDAAEALTALQDRDGDPRGMSPDEPTLLAESKELESGSDDDEKSGNDDPLAGIPLTSYSQQDYAGNEPRRGTGEDGQVDDDGLLAGSSESNESTETKKCNCKKSRCLKLYCECFSSGIFCEGACMCRECLNVVQFTSLVTETRQHIIDRSPNAFAPKVSTDGGHKKGCHCKKSRCLKKYCECYQANVPCTEACRCENCMNNGPNAPRDDSPQESSFFDGGGPPVSKGDTKTNGSQGQHKQNSGGNASNTNGSGPPTQSRQLQGNTAHLSTFAGRPPPPLPLSRAPQRPAHPGRSILPRGPMPPSRAAPHPHWPLPADGMKEDSGGGPRLPCRGPQELRHPAYVPHHPTQQVSKTLCESEQQGVFAGPRLLPQGPHTGGRGFEGWPPAAMEWWSHANQPPSEFVQPFSMPESAGGGHELTYFSSAPPNPGTHPGLPAQGVLPVSGLPRMIRIPRPAVAGEREAACATSAHSQAGVAQWQADGAHVQATRSTGHADSHHAHSSQEAADFSDAQREAGWRGQNLACVDWLHARRAGGMAASSGAYSAGSAPASQFQRSQPDRSCMPAASDVMDDATSPPPPTVVLRRRTNSGAQPPAKTQRTATGAEDLHRCVGVGIPTALLERSGSHHMHTGHRLPAVPQSLPQGNPQEGLAAEPWQQIGANHSRGTMDCADAIQPQKDETADYQEGKENGVPGIQMAPFQGRALPDKRSLENTRGLAAHRPLHELENTMPALV